MNYIPRYSIALIRNGSVCAESRTIKNSHSVYALLREYFAQHDREEMVAVLLDAKNKVIGVNTVSIGTLNLSLVHPRETFKAAILASAAGIILAHNHPSGDATPSQEDRALTTRLREAGKLIGIAVLDHIIFGEDGSRKPYTSFRDDGL